MDRDQLTLRDSGLKVTQHRLKILALFNISGRRHWTAESIYQHLRNTDALEIGLATVYRALTQFEEAGLIERHQFESGKSIFELASNDHHDHIICIQCGWVEEFHDAALEERQRSIAQERHFALQGHSLNLFVDCLKPHCERREAGEDGA